MMIAKADDTTQIVLDPDDSTQNTFVAQYVLPANILTNGVQYQARVRVAPRDGQWSDWSEPIKFYCFGMPLFYFLINGDAPHEHNGVVRVENSSVTVGLYYKQAQREGLKSFKVDLYSADGRKIMEGQESYDVGNIRYDTSDMSVTIRGLEDDNMYSIVATGETDHGMIIESDRVYLEVDYEHPATFSLIDVENIEKDATIRIHSNLVVVEGHAFPDPPKYIDNERVDLTSYGSYVVFDKGFNLNDDFTLHLVGQNFHEYENILEIRNGSYDITLTFMRGWYDQDMTEKAYLILDVHDQDVVYEQISNMIDVPYFDDSLHIYVRRRGNLYDADWCTIRDGSHQVKNPKEFDVQFRSQSDWDAVIVEGYQNVQEDRLEF